MLDKKKKYLQIALNSTLQEAEKIISKIPLDERVIIEAGTPLIKTYGISGIRAIRRFWERRVLGTTSQATKAPDLITIYRMLKEQQKKKTMVKGSPKDKIPLTPYVVADLKCMDRGLTELMIAKEGGANAATVLGQAPVETIDVFIEKCQELNLDSMIDMMNVEYPLGVLGKLKQLPDVVILHRGVDEEDYNPEKEIPYYEIQRIKSQYDILIAVAGGDTIQEVQVAIFNDVDIVVLWRAFYASSEETVKLAEEFLKEIR